MSDSAPPILPRAATSAAPDPQRLVIEALTRSGLLWVRTPPPTDAAEQAPRDWPVWHVAVEGSAYVVTGPGEQPLPELPDTVMLVLRSKETRSRLLTVPASVRRVRPDDADWEPATTALKAARLNPDVRLERIVATWAVHATVLALTPLPGDALVGAQPDEGSHAAPPLPSPATTR